MAPLILEAEDLMQRTGKDALDKNDKSPVNPPSLIARKQVEKNQVSGEMVEAIRDDSRCGWKLWWSYHWVEAEINFTFSVVPGLCTELLCKALGHSITVMNVYGPYEKKQEFWEKFFAMAVVKDERLIIGGDLNFTMNRSEVWGDSARVDRLVDFFKQHIKLAGLVMWSLSLQDPHGETIGLKWQQFPRDKIGSWYLFLC
jgi:hypothetical protein